MPDEGAACKSALEPGNVQSILQEMPEMLLKYENFALSRYIESSEDCASCPTPGCEYVGIRDTHAGASADAGATAGHNAGRFDCPLCKKTFCLEVSNTLPLSS